MTVKTLEFIAYNSPEFSEIDFEDLITLFQEETRESDPKDPLPPRSFTRRNIELMDENPFFRPNIYLIRHDAKALAWLGLWLPHPESPDYEQKKHMAFMGAYVLAETRNQGIGKQLLRFACDLGRKNGISVLQGGTDIQDGQFVAQRIGASIALDTRSQRAYMNEIDWEMVEQWRKSGQERNPNTRIIQFDGLYSEDEEQLAKYCNVLSALARSVPDGELEGTIKEISTEQIRQDNEAEEKRGSIWSHLITQEADGSISGITEIIYHSDCSFRVGQGLTGVLEAEQGRGLGKWLKAEMLLHIKERFPDVEFIGTFNAETNAPMRSINERVGFKLYKQSIIYKIQIDDAMKYLDLL